MQRPQRPWWLIVNKPAGLITDVREEYSHNERLFTIRGEPLVQGLAWLTWGPVGALLVVALLTTLAILFEVRDRSNLVIQSIFILAYLGLPAVAWGITTLGANRLAEKHLQAERQAETQECLIRLNQKRGEFSFRTARSSAEVELSYDEIRQVKVSAAIGARDSRKTRLILETEHGSIILLDEKLGNQAQKSDLAHEIRTSLAEYERKKNPPSTAEGDSGKLLD